MHPPGTLSALASDRLDRFKRLSERGIRLAADPRLGIGLLLATAIENAAAAAALLAGVRHGWSQFAGLGAHIAVVLLLVGAGIGFAFGRETTFSLLTGDQALLDDPRPGFTDALRLDRLDAAFATDGRPTRLDT